LPWGYKHRNAGRPPIVPRDAGCGAHVSAQFVCEHGHHVDPGEVEPEPEPGSRGGPGWSAKDGATRQV
jgi:hypothetical protein